MLMQMAWILAIIGTVTEVLLVHKVRFVDHAYTKGTHLFWVKKWHVDGVVWNTVGSFGLSYLQGVMFGATGLVIAVGGALGTGISMLYFELEKWIQKTYGYATMLLFLKAQFSALQARMPELKVQIARTWQLAKDVWGVVRFFLKVITFPFWGYRWAKRCWNDIQTKYMPTTVTKGVT